jgi:signal peptidase I
MTEHATPKSTKRQAWLAVGLSILMPGVGHAYCGKLLRGLIFGLLYAIGIPVVLGLLAYASPTSTVTFGLLMVVAAFGVVIGAAVDSYRLARRTRRDYDLKAYNCPGVYILLGLMIQGSCLGYALHVRSSLFEAFRVPSVSEFPTIVPNDRILVDKMAYRHADPQRGDTVLFRPPDENWRTYYIKRVVALEGDSVAVKDGMLYINGEKLPARKVARSLPSTAHATDDRRPLEGEFLEETNESVCYTIFVATSEQDAIQDFPETIVPRNHCFVLGDNRSQSRDSRHFGSIPYAVIEGRADYIYWPADKWSRFGRLD